ALSGLRLCPGLSRYQRVQRPAGSLPVHLARVAVRVVPRNGAGLLVGRATSRSAPCPLAGTASHRRFFAGGLRLLRAVQGRRYVHWLELPVRFSGRGAVHLPGRARRTEAAAVLGRRRLDLVGVRRFFLELPGAVTLEGFRSGMSPSVASPPV